MCKTRRRDGVVVDGVCAANDVFDRRHALCGSSVRQHENAVGIANAVQVWRDDLGAVLAAREYAHMLIDWYEPSALECHANRFKAEICRGRRAPRGHHARVNLELVYLFAALGVGQLDAHRRLAELAGRHFGGKHVCVEIDGARIDQEALCEARDLCVESGHDVGHGFNESDVRSERSVHVGKLKTDVAGADDGNPIGHVL
mmetsp:Transcript_639/g.1671  ORF Transcript_639/g.1671 Transcript_639/m.1671 type:complete len:201 (-) Transcript_639:775-1377(-)